ncbi:hypothetical protein [Plebeiibacterium marinum]|uniref:Uncharacterized protein n=1 Tax=Plebeiibacterium marinum TaxID=2992111 RepID=A0AAE3SK76_9BACT|nr:hypothetical protein [Plebeiobacterium marinum]MCW3806274.1 hypothetical protein [Plebeiobacterium marinum]
MRKFFTLFLITALTGAATYSQNSTENTVSFKDYPQNLGPTINTSANEYAALVTPWDSLMYFTSTRGKKMNTHGNEKIYYCLGAPNDSSIQVYPTKGFKKSVHISIAGVDSKNEKILFYKGKRKNGSLNSAKINYGKVLKKKILKGAINHVAYRESSISIAEDGSAYVVIDRVGGHGKKDIWVCKHNGSGRFSGLQNLGSVINTKYNEEAVYISPDGNTLYFSSEGHDSLGGYDIFKTTKNEDGSWTEPVNMGSMINSPANELFFQPYPGDNIILFSSDRDGGNGGYDIYSISVNE